MAPNAVSAPCFRVGFARRPSGRFSRSGGWTALGIFVTPELPQLAITLPRCSPNRQASAVIVVVGLAWPDVQNTEDPPT